MRWTLSVKIVLGIAAVLIAAMSVSVILNVIFVRSQLMADSRRYAIHLSEVAEAGLENAMIIKDPEKIKSIMQSIGSRADIVGAAVFNKRGEIKYSINPGDVGRIFSKNDPMCIICHDRTLTDQTQTVILPYKQSARILKVVRPIMNQPHCQGCHQERVLGMLVVDLSLAEVDQQATAVLGQQFRQSLATVLIVIIVLIGFMHLIVTRPLAHFVRITRAIDNGDLDKRVNLTHKDEIGELGASFDRMVESMANRTQELERLNEIAATQITERKRIEKELRRNQDASERLAQEIAIIAEIGKVIGSSLDIDEVYEKFAAEARKLIPSDRLAVNLHSLHEEHVKVAYTSGEKVPGRFKGDLFPLKGSTCEVLAKTRAGLYSHPKNVEEMNHPFSNPYASVKAGIRSLLRVPLIYRDKVIGSLHFGLKTPDAYTERDLRLAERIGAQIAGAIGSAQLFSDLKKMENSLRESEGRFRGLVEQAAVGVAEIEMSTGRFFTVNRRLCEMVGRTEEELLATTFQAITHPEDVHLHEEKARMMLAGEIGHYNLEKRYLRKDGGIVWVNITVSPLWKPGEAPGRNIAVTEEITDRKQMEAEILSLSITDQLTGLHNRRGFLSLAGQQFKLAIRNKSGMLLFFADLDGLKWINDTLGHEEGDKALIEAATIFKETFRTSDIIARLGGDEYAALAVDITEENSEIFTARLQSLIDTQNNQESRRYRLSISVGCSYYNPENPCSIDELMASADKLMYEHKQNKKGLLLQAASLSSSNPYPFNAQ